MDPALVPLVRASRRPAGLLARVIAWPAVVLLLSGAVSATQDDALASGVLSVVVIVGACGVLAAVDGLVLRRRAVLLVWSVTLLVLGVAFESVTLPTLVQDGRLTWQAASREVLAALPYGLPVTLVGLAGPVLLGAFVGRLVGRRAAGRPAQEATVLVG